MSKISVNQLLNMVRVDNGIVTVKDSGNKYNVIDFIDRQCEIQGYLKKERRELERALLNTIIDRSEKSKIIEDIIEKYDFKFSDGVYFINGSVITLDNLYRFLWKQEKLLPTESDDIIENVEKISEPIQLQENIFNEIKAKAIKGESKYLKSLYSLYPHIKWKQILYNILVPNTKPLFHIFYDEGVGGTGKSTLLEVLTKIVGENFTSNVLLDQFGNRFIFSNMLGKYLNIGDDNGKNDELQNVGTLKSIITGNRVTIDRKNISPIEVRIFAKQLFATNIMPYIDFTDGGIMRRLNIIPMNIIIPPDMKLCELNNEEIGHIIYEVLQSNDLKKGSNDLAITTSPIYRFYNNAKNPTYEEYIYYCEKNGFRKMNIINFETKIKFINAYKTKTLSIEQLKEEELPF